MSKAQDFIDKTLPALGVVVNADFVRDDAVLACLSVMKYREFSGKDNETVLKELEGYTSYVIWCSIADDQLPFGPTLTIRGEAEPGKLTVPWHQIIAIVQLHEPLKLTQMGFSAPAKETKE